MKSITKHVIAIGIASTLAVGAFAGTAYAYFTDVVEAKGQHSIEFGYDGKTTEDVDESGKHIRIENTGDTDIYARVLIFGLGSASSGNATVEIGDDEGSSKWKRANSEPGQDAAIYQYDGILAPGATTSDLWVKISAKDGINDKDTLYDFDVIVVGQVSPVAYTADNKPYPYNWSNSTVIS